MLLIQDAEMASLTDDPNAFKLYDVAVKYVLRHYPATGRTSFNMPL